MAEQTISLNPSESRLVSFEAVPHEARTYLVSVDGLSGSFVAVAPPVAKFEYVSNIRRSYFSVPPLPGWDPGWVCNPRDDYQLWEVDVQNIGNTVGECIADCFLRTHGELWGVDYPWAPWSPDKNFEFTITCSMINCCYNAEPYRINRLTLQPGEVKTFRGLTWAHHYYNDIWAVQAKFEGDAGIKISSQFNVIDYGP